MLGRMIIVCVALTFGASSGENAANPAPSEYKPEEWASPLAKIRDQLNLLALFAQATSFGGMKVKVPQEIQRVPLELIPGTESLREKNIDFYVKEIELKDLAFEPDKDPTWMQTRPVLPTLLRFATIGLSVDAKTKLGRIPLGATFRDGVLPFDFDMKKDGYDLSVLPERRSTDAKLDNLKLQIGGPLTSAFVNTFFKDDVAKLIMKYGMGQTLKMGESGLFGGQAPTSLLGVKKGSAEDQAINSVLNTIMKKK